MTIKLERCIDASLSTIPPVCCGPRGREWRFTKLTRSMTARLSSGMTFRTFPVLPRSRPVMTMTLSFLRIVIRLENLRSERNDLHKFFGSEFPRHGTENASPDGLHLIID